MAKRVIETLTSDLSGVDIPDDSAGGTVEFAVSGSQYAIDLTEDELSTFNEILAPYVGSAQRLSRRGAAISKTTVSASGEGRRTKEQLTAIRKWAKQNGHEVSERGRVARPILDAFDAAH